MADIAIIHPNIMRSGGGSAVAAETIETLTEEHDVTLYTTGTFDVPKFNDRYGTSIGSAEIDVQLPLNRVSTVVKKGASVVNSMTGKSLSLDAFLAALLQRWLRANKEGAHELFVSTSNELFIDSPSLEYIHFPVYSGAGHASEEDWASEDGYALYRRICRRIAYPGTEYDNTTVLTNSEWTADRVREAYTRQPSVVYPPVRTSDFNSPDWKSREDGIVAIGRIHPSKRQKTLIQILDRLQSKGYDLHLHIVGGFSDEKYGEEIRDLASSRDYILLEGYSERKKLIELVKTHKYGLHGRNREHFGIAVAELAAGGAIPFVPDGGGQTEIVGERDETIYQGPEDAVRKIADIHDNPNWGQTLSDELQSESKRFDSRRFKREIQEYVEDALNQV